jgi:cytoskeletal protein CcmA (bactofilin family)|tara:strand:+ start:2008 stop:2418 length:411 start_codon:yes stop_codon:yes gene_type:complete
MKNFDLSASCNTIEKNTTFVGNFVSESDFRIDGTFEGSIETKGKVVIGEKGSINGTIVCSSADIAGNFTGTIQVKDLLSVESTGSVEGDVTISKLIVESGAIFNAKSSMKEEQEISGGLKKITNFSDSHEKTEKTA